ncbi:MAG: peptidoglycan DD-metalloendopeptidase family protein [Planctomycetota bacterium]
MLAGAALAGQSPSTSLRIKLPFAKGTQRKCLQGNHGAASHADGVSNFAYDFEMPEGTPVLAAAAGRVIFVKQDSTLGGPTPDMLPFGNKVWIDHGGGTYSIYVHLQANSALVRPGELVDAGQQLARSGNTGYSFGPHLHFALTDATQKTTPSRFVDVASRGVPATGNSYTSGNDGNDTSEFRGDSIFAPDMFEPDGITLHTSMPATCLAWTDTYSLRGRSTRAAKQAVLYFFPRDEPKAVVWHTVPLETDGAFTIRFKPSDFADALSTGGPFRVGVASDGTAPSKVSVDVCFTRSARDEAGNALVLLRMPFPIGTTYPYARVPTADGDGYTELVEFATPENSAVLAAAAGRVIALGRADALHTRMEDRPRSVGSHVRVDHGQGVITDYLGLAASSIEVIEGEVVRAGRKLGLTSKSPLTEERVLGFGVRRHGQSGATPRFVGLGNAQTFSETGEVTAQDEGGDVSSFASDSSIVPDCFRANGVLTASELPMNAFHCASTYFVEGTALEGVSRVAFLVRRRAGRKLAASVIAAVTDGAFRLELRLSDVEKRLGTGPWDWALSGATTQADFAAAHWLPLTVLR